MRTVLERRSTRRELRHVTRQLERLDHEKSARVDVAGDRARILQEIAATIVEFKLTARDGPATDAIVDGHFAAQRRSLERRAHAGRAALDRLEVVVSALAAQLEERADEACGVLTELQGVAANVWDQVGEPETPNLDPVRGATTSRRSATRTNGQGP